MKGWYVATQPFLPDPARARAATVWPQACWLFLADYLQQRFGNHWCLAPEPSLALQAGDWTLPSQLVVRTPAGSNKPTALPAGHSVLDLRLRVAEADVEARVGLRVMTLPAALAACPAETYRQRPALLRAGLSLIADPEPLLSRLHTGGHSRVAGRLAGALRNIGRGDVADGIRDRFRGSGQRVSEADPFDQPTPVLMRRHAFSPYPSPPSLRRRWQSLREHALAARPAVPPVAAPLGGAAAWISGARTPGPVTDLLDPDPSANVPATARYVAAFEEFLSSAGQVLTGTAPGTAAAAGLPRWHRALTEPSATPPLHPGLEDGYRCHPLAPRRTAPPAPRHEAVRDLMPELFRCLNHEPDRFTAAVLGLLTVLELQPFATGNGVLGVWLMNLCLAAGGYPYSVFEEGQHADLTVALTAARVDGDCGPLAARVARAVSHASARRSDW